MTPHTRGGAVLALLALAACQTTPSGLGPGTRLAPNATAVQEQLQGLRDRGVQVRSLRGSAHVALRSPQGSLSRPQRLVAERPDRLRIEVLALFDQVAAVLATDGQVYSFVDLRSRQRESGPVDDRLLWRSAGIDLAPRELVSLLLGSAPLRAGEVAVAAQRFENGAMEVELGGDAMGTTSRVVVGPAGAMRRFERRDAAGALLWDADFAHFEASAGVPFARSVSMQFARVDAELEVEFHHVELNAELPEGVFVLHVPTGG